MSGVLQARQNVNSEVAPKSRSHVKSPYVGLVPFSEKHAEFFYGRKEVSKIIAANLRAARLTLVYGPSGVGKSSVLRAGVVSPLRKIASHDLETRGAPDFAVVYFYLWASDPLEDLSQAIREAVQTSLGLATVDSIPATRSLVEIIKTWTERYGIELLIILDQFEEYFLYHEDERGAGTFAEEFAKAANDQHLRARFLLSMRDDTLSRLDRFEGSIPTLFDNRLQIEHLDLDDAREAIIQPVKKYNALYAKERPFVFDHEKANGDLVASGKSDSLVNEVLSQVQVGKVIIGVTGQGVVKKEKDSDAAQSEALKSAIEAPYLQLVMTRLWNDEETIKTHELKAATLKKLGGAQRIVEEHLDKVMEGLSEAEQDIAAAAFYYLVTPSGTKIAHTVKTLAEYTKHSQEEIMPLMIKLLKVSEGEEKSEGDEKSEGEEKEEYRILRQVPIRVGGSEVNSYEVYHDALGPAVLAWSEKHQKEHEKYDERKKARFWTAGISLVLVVLGTAAISISRYYEQQRQAVVEEANRTLQAERDKAQAREELLISEKNNQESYQESILSLASLTSGSTEEKGQAIQALQQQIEKNELDPKVVPLIKRILEEVAKSQPQSATGLNAQEVANQIAQQSKDTRLSPRVYIQIQDDGQREIAKYYQQQLNEHELIDIPNVRPKIIAPGIEKVGTRKNITISELRYFHPTELERQIGEQLVSILNNAGLTNVVLKPIGGYESNPDIRPNHYELWLSSVVR
jgi:ribosomal protein L16/L10AE